jgi:hypothetical protein
MGQTNLFDHLKKQEMDHDKVVDALGDGVDNNMKRMFLAYHDANPEVFDKFCDLSLRAIRKGFKHYGSMGIIQLMRWETGVTADDPQGFKVNNNYAPFYARMFESVYPEYKGFYRKRSSLAD